MHQEPQAKLLELRQADERDGEVVFKNCAPFLNCISEINKTQVDNVKDLDVAIPVYNLVEYSNNYSKTSGALWPHCKEEPDDDMTSSKSFKSKVKTTRKPLLMVMQQMLK